ncbi:hypothetical protein [Kribbia dieselivorans]|uniref:hypothetical protein n=1 Tax=Kribbia dieselivorans TaxID=331526 RepID=UPI0012ED098A|nr:hypothetical protein [Kribbia dieselivorans]
MKATNMKFRQKAAQTRLRPQCHWVTVPTHDGGVRLEMRWTLGSPQSHRRAA